MSGGKTAVVEAVTGYKYCETESRASQSGMMSGLRKYSVYSKSSSHESLDDDPACRLLFLGAGSVGKTSIIQKFLRGASKPTGGRTERTERTERTVHEMYSANLNFASGVNVSLSIEDTGANYSQNFPDMFVISIREANVVVLVYSVKDSASAEYISDLRETIVSKRPDLPIVVVGNMTEDERAVLSLQEMEAIACLDWEVGYTKCSARLDLNIQEVFREAVIQAGLVPRFVSLLVPNTTKSSLLKRFIFRQKNRTKHSELSNVSIY